MIAVEELIAANPFPGLRSFKPGEADRFFGREQQIEDLVARLGESPLVAVAGASGCGKSSLVLAGLLNRLEQHRAAGGSIEWWPVVLRPGNHPIASLAAGLAAVLGSADDENRAASLDGRLRLGGRGLVEAVRLARLEAHVRVLVVVDQFEEIFRFKRMTDPEEAMAFVKLLLHAAREPDSHVSVVLTLRSDALGHCADFRDLPETINRGQYLVPRLTREQRKEAIAKPVALRGFKIAPRLVQRILNDVTDDFDDLPVMQHVLTRTWQYWATASQGARSIDIVDYEATGAAAEALSNHADEAYESLTGLPGAVERTFRTLTERVVDGTERRRPLNFDQLCGVTGCDKANVEQVVERFRRPDTAFLMPSPEVSLTTNPVIDISHESLIRQWQRLRQWTQREAESRAELLRLVEAARLYARKEGDFWRGRDLERVLEWRSNEQPTAPWVSLCTGGDGASQWKLAETFLADSEQAAERERKYRQRLVWTRRSAFFAVVVITVVAALSVAFVQWQSKSRAKSSELANQALLELDEDPARSAHLALAAIDHDPDNARAEYALRQSLATLEIAHVERIVSLAEPITDARFTRDESRIVVATQNNIRVYDTRSYELVRGPFARENDVFKAWLIANNTLVTLTGDGQAQIQSVDNGPISALACTGDKNDIYTLAVSPDEQHIAAGCHNGEIIMWVMSGAGARQRLSLAQGGTDAATITALSFSADNKYLASGDADGAVTI
jgi:energy-coupling factor transporter ATP-binding protein EcfA2